MIGKTILHYKILEKLGEGGMGVVYKAQDTKLERTVALKLLPAHLLISEEDRSRFNREAKAAAALSHPNIATVFEINEFEDNPFIVMEYIEGKTLNSLLEKELFKLKDAISIAIQVAEGLKAAHSKNIVHRDIKCGNIILSKEGQAKILDFGLAKTNMSTKLTKLGSTLGTVAYMSPEQVTGGIVDHRTDLWSLGIVIFELLTGRFPFAGEYDQAIFYNILNEQPEPLTAIRSGVPMSLEWIVNKLLVKNPDERYQNANDLIIDLKAVDIKSSGFSRTGQTIVSSVQKSQEQQFKTQTGPKEKTPKTRFIKKTILPVSFFIVAVLAALITWNLHPEEVKQVRKFQWSSDYSFFELSPDGKKIVYSKGDVLWIRYLDKIDPIEIKTDEIISDVFWSPNSDYIAYFTGAGTTEAHELRKVSVNGVGNILIVKTGNNYYPRFWGTDDSILVTTWDNKGENTLLKVPSSGGELKPICGGDSSFSMIKGNLSNVLGLPDGKSLLISTNYGAGRNEIILQTEKKRTVLYTSSVENFIERPVYSGTGHILFPLITRNSSDIWAITFNASSLELTGSPFLVARNADRPSVSQTGMLLYEDRGITSNGEQLVLLSRSGQILKKIGPPQLDIYSPAVSPDGKKIATASSEENGEYNIWLYDIIKGTKSQLSYDVPQTWGSSWSPDSKKIVFASGFGENADIFEQEINSTASAKPFIHTEQSEGNPYWSANGQFILFIKTETKPTRQNDIWYLEMNKGSAPKRLLESKFNEDYPWFSPNGKFVSFMSDKSGQQEVYVTNFPAADKQWQVSFNGGIYPQWIGDEIFFVNRRSNELMVVKVKTDPDFQSGIPIKLFSADSAGIMLMNDNYLEYTITRDGKNIVAVKNLTGSAQEKLILVENWFEEFRNKSETK